VPQGKKAMNWEIQISGDTRDLKELSKSLVNDELRIIARDGQFYLESTRFESLSRSEEVRSVASEMLPILTGATRLALGGRMPLGIGGIARLKGDGTREIFLLVSDMAHVMEVATVEIQGSNGTVQVVNPADKVPGWVNLGLADPKVAKALRLLGTEEHDWVSLYRLYEVIEDDVGEMQEIVEEGWATKSSIRRFKHTANSPAAVGDASRHGKEATAVPPNPMELGEARSLVEIILHNWLRSKL
jgi:hypothetical protein